MRELVGEARMLELVSKEMAAYVSDSIRAGRLNDQAAALVRLFKGIGPEPDRDAGLRGGRPGRGGLDRRHGSVR